LPSLSLPSSSSSFSHSTPPITTKCYNRRPITYTYNCPDVFEPLIVVCNGTAGTFINRCPSYYRETLCIPNTNTNSNSNSNSNSDFIIETTNTTETETTCLVRPLFNNDTNIRRLSSSSSLSFDIKAIIALRTEVHDVVYTKTAYPDEEKNKLIIVSTVMGIGIVIVIMMMILLWADRKKVDVVDIIVKHHQAYANRNKVDWTTGTNTNTNTNTNINNNTNTNKNTNMNTNTNTNTNINFNTKTNTNTNTNTKTGKRTC